VLYGDECCLIEFKCAGNKLSTDQQDRCDELAKAECTVRVCYDLQTAIDYVATVLPVPELADNVEPDTRIASEALAEKEAYAGQKLYVAPSTVGPVVVAWNDHLRDWGCVRLATALDERTLPARPRLARS
jgi:hypothetical protein